jgi:hypothetical protein
LAGAGVTFLLAVMGAVADWVPFREKVEALTGISVAALPYGPWLPTAALVVLVLLAALVVAILYRLANPATVTQAEPAAASTAHPQARREYLEYMRKDIAERLRASIHYEVIKLQPQERFGAAQPWHYVSYRDSDAARSFSDFAAVFSDADLSGRVLLLGDPGSGKSTTLLLLAERLVAEALADPDRPIPLLESLSQFQDFPPAAAAGPETTQSGPFKRRRDPADDRWIQTRLARLVGDRKGISRRLNATVVDDWIESGSVVFLLDGLDEVEESRRAALADRLNRTLLQHHADVPTVIASRVVEYRIVEREPEKRLRLNGAVTLRPLSDEQIGDYLDRAGAGGLKHLLPHDAALRELARAPLTLSMMTVAYHGLHADEIRADLAGADQRRALFDRFVDRMMQRAAWRRRGEPWDPRSPLTLKTPYSRDQVNRYLGWLALALSQRVQTRFDARRLWSLLQTEPVVGDRDRRDPIRVGYIASLCVCLALAALGIASGSAGPGIAAAVAGAAIGSGLGVYALLARSDRTAVQGVLMLILPLLGLTGFLVWVSALSGVAGWLPGPAVLAPFMAFLLLALALLSSRESKTLGYLLFGVSEREVVSPWVLPAILTVGTAIAAILAFLAWGTARLGLAEQPIIAAALLGGAVGIAIQAGSFQTAGLMLAGTLAGVLASGSPAPIIAYAGSGAALGVLGIFALYYGDEARLYPRWRWLAATQRAMEAAWRRLLLAPFVALAMRECQDDPAQRAGSVRVAGLTALGAVLRTTAEQPLAQGPLGAALAAVESACADPEETVRAAAIALLPRAAIARKADLILRALADRSPKVRAAAVGILPGVALDERHDRLLRAARGRGPRCRCQGDGRGRSGRLHRCPAAAPRRPSRPGRGGIRPRQRQVRSLVASPPCAGGRSSHRRPGRRHHGAGPDGREGGDPIHSRAAGAAESIPAELEGRHGGPRRPAGLARDTQTPRLCPGPGADRRCQRRSAT